MARYLSAILFAALLSACAASRTAYYDANAKSAEANAAAVKAKFDALALAAGRCETEGCTGMAMMGIALTDTPVAQPVKQYEAPGWKLIGLGQQALQLGANAYSEDSRNDLFGGLFEAFASNAGDRSVRIDQSNNSRTNNSVNDSYNDSSDNSQHNQDNDTSTAQTGDGSAFGNDNDLNNGPNSGNSGELCADQSCIEAPVVVVEPVVIVPPVVVVPESDDP